MRLSEYDKIPALSPADTFILDTAAGTRSILAEDLAKSLPNLDPGAGNGLSGNIQELDTASNLKINDALMVGTERGNEKIEVSDAIFKLIDPILTVAGRRNVWRGKNLGSVVTDEQYAEIGAQTFRGLFLGDYWEINEYIWRIVDFDYWLGTGDTECTTHHLVIMPDKCLDQQKMNDTNTTEGGYYFSKMHQEYMATANSIVRSAFPNHLLSFRSYLTNAVTNGYPSGGSWYTEPIILPNEIMMYGCPIFTPSNNGTTIPNLYTIDKTQLAAMRLNPNLINPHRENQWLRDVVSASHFALVNSHGYASSDNASYVLGVRPVFGIKAA